MTAKLQVHAASFHWHCVATRAFLDRSDFVYTEHRLVLPAQERDEIVRRCGAISVPQAFVNGERIRWHGKPIAMSARRQLDTLIAP